MQRFSHPLVFALLSAFVIGGCSGKVDGGGSGGNGGSAGSSGQGGQAGGGMGGQGGSGGQGSGIPCGGLGGAVCSATEYCDYPDDLCGAADGMGTCKIKPEACPEFYSPTCACDGKVYGNSCEAGGAGQDVSNLGGCPAPAGMFGCGFSFCNLATDFCMKTASDVPGVPDSYSCAPLPAACGNVANCACIGDPCGAPIPGMCDQAASGGITMTCPGG